MWCYTPAARRLTLVLVATFACDARAQSRTTRRASTADSVFARARQLVVNGNGAAGRVLVDSVVAATEPGTPAYADALFWRASLAATDVDAERDYRRIIVDYSLSPRASDALLKLAQLEAARGDRAGAASHLERYMVDNPNSTESGSAGLLLVRLAFEQNEPQRGCIALGRALSDVPAGEVELRNQLDYYSPRCAGVDTTRGAPPVVAASVQASTSSRPKPKSMPQRKAALPAHAANGHFTLQVAAYTSRVEARRMVARLKARGVEARVVGTANLFRVRVGRYATRAAAAAAAKSLKARKIDAFVTKGGAADK